MNNFQLNLKETTNAQHKSFIMATKL